MTIATASQKSSFRIIGVIGAGHFISHFYLLVLPPLFPLLKDAFGVSYTSLGLLITVFSIVSGFAHIPMGFLVDRFGARNLLILGMFLEAIAFLLMGWIGTYEGILICIFLAGLANSVYHPADYAILSASVDDSRMGQAFSLHTFAGFSGGAVAPLTVIFIAATWNWQMAFIATGIFGLILTALVVINRDLLEDRRPAEGTTNNEGGSAAKTDSGQSGMALLFSMPILMCFLFFVMLAMSAGGINTYAISAFVSTHGLTEEGAGIALTGFLVGTSLGILLGGYVADRTRHHERVAMFSFTATAAIVFAIGMVQFPLILLTAMMLIGGLLYGMIMPSRDMLVRAVTPEGSMGKVFGFVSTGLNVGSAITPLLFGYILDSGNPRYLFFTVPIFMLLAVGTVIATKMASTNKVLPNK